jgi:hypothetical protein
MSDEEIQSVAKQAEAHYDWLKDQVHLQYDEIQELKERIDKAIDKIQYIIDYGFDYDGFNNVEDLKGLIDMLVQYAVESRNTLKGEDKE